MTFLVSNRQERILVKEIKHELPDDFPIEKYRYVGEVNLKESLEKGELVLKEPPIEDFIFDRESTILSVLYKSGLCSGGYGEARRMISCKSVFLNGDEITDFNFILKDCHTNSVLSVGKRKSIILK